MCLICVKWSLSKIGLPCEKSKIAATTIHICKLTTLIIWDYASIMSSKVWRCLLLIYGSQGHHWPPLGSSIALGDELIAPSSHQDPSLSANSTPVQKTTHLEKTRDIGVPLVWAHAAQYGGLGVRFCLGWRSSTSQCIVHEREVNRRIGAAFSV